MRRLLTVLLLLTAAIGTRAVERVTLEQLQADWAGYQDRMVQLTTPLIVCGNYYDSLVLAPVRLVSPDEKAVGLADGDSTDYRRIAEHNRAVSICIHCRNNYYNVRTGDRVHGLKARVTGPRQLLTGQTPKVQHVRKPALPKAGKDELRIVGANIENYFADLGGYATRRTTPAQQAMKTRKVVKALKAMRADMFAFCEMQVGTKAPEMLLQALNRGGARYAYVSMPMADADRIGGCFFYRTDRFRPYGEPIPAYKDTASHYHARMFAQGFEHTASGERFIVSLNHTKSKSTRRHWYDTNSKRMENTDSLLAMLPEAVTRFGDTDVLLLGDYNCYTAEQPIQTLVRAGYGDMLQVYCPDDYSYSYHSETGYLDRCFASPSMATQIVRVTPWHVNADWYYSHAAYKMRDKTCHRYADHDPIIVDIKLKK